MSKSYKMNSKQYKLNSMGNIEPYMTNEDWKEIVNGPFYNEYDYEYYCRKCKTSFDDSCNCVEKTNNETEVKTCNQNIKHPNSWNKDTHYGQCGQSCPCCRTIVGDKLGSCLVCIKN